MLRVGGRALHDDLGDVVGVMAGHETGNRRVARFFTHDPSPPKLSIELRADRLHQRAPMLGVVFDQLGKLRRREVDTLEAVGLEKLTTTRSEEHTSELQ